METLPTLAVAESCTGGLVTKIITDKPGSSRYFLLGVVAYSNTAKTGVLGIPAALLADHGAVSKAAALAMARAVKKLAGASCGIGVTGIAGPAGAVRGKPVGTVFIAVETPVTAVCKKFVFKGTRAQIRTQAARTALTLLNHNLTIPVPHT